MFSVYLSLDDEDSYFDFGGYDSDLVNELGGEIYWEPITGNGWWTTTWNGLFYSDLEIDVVGDVDGAILDTGTSYTYVPTVVFDRWTETVSEVHGVDNCGYVYGLFACYCDVESDMELTYFEFEEAKYGMDQFNYVAYESGVCIFLLSSLDLDGAGLLGDSFLRSFYVIHDHAEQSVGLVAKDGYIDGNQADWTTAKIVLTIIFTLGFVFFGLIGLIVLAILMVMMCTAK